MKVLIVNPILYTSETAAIKPAASIKDTMIYDLCLAFYNLGHEITLFAGDVFHPTEKEDYPFRVIWSPCRLKKLCKPHVLPYCPKLKALVKNEHFDLIISSEVFSLNSLLLAGRCKNNLLIWHELAKHNRLMKQIPSKLWYSIVARLFFRHTRIIPRSAEAKAFIKRYCANVSDTIIDHGVNLEKFPPCEQKEKFFIVSSQLIARKQIDKTIHVFSDFVAGHPDYQLYICGEGDKENELKQQVNTLQLNEAVTFLGKVPHETLKSYLSRAAAMLIYTKKDNNMVSVVESIACGTPVITTSVPYNASYIRQYALGIVDDNWDAEALNTVVNDSVYIRNCLAYRDKVSTVAKVKQFLAEACV